MPLAASGFGTSPERRGAREQAVNNFPRRRRRRRCSRRAVNILGGTTDGHFGGEIGESARSLIEQSKARRPEKSAEGATGIRPGNRGKDGGDWCFRPLRGASRDRHVSPVPLDGVATDPVLRQRNCAARRELRNRVRAETGPWPVSGHAPMQLPRGLRLLLHDQYAAVRSGGSPTLRKARLEHPAGRAKGGPQRGVARDGNNPPAFRAWGGSANRDHPTASRTQPER